jgi:surface antigen
MLNLSRIALTVALSLVSLVTLPNTNSNASQVKPGEGTVFQIKSARDKRYCLSIDYSKIGIIANASNLKVEPCQKISEMLFRHGGNNSILLNKVVNGNTLALEVDFTKIGKVSNANSVKLGLSSNIQEQKITISPVNGGYTLEFGANDNLYKVESDVTKVGIIPNANLVKVVKTQTINLESTWVIEPINQTTNNQIAQVALNACSSAGYGCTRPGYNGVDSWGYHNSSSWNGNFKHNCTAYAAWQATQLGASHPGINLGNAKTWAVNASSSGIPVTTNPVVGSVAVREIGTYGHVAVVESVEGDYLWVSEDNWDGNNGGWTSVRKVHNSYFQKYILFGRLGR